MAKAMSDAELRRRQKIQGRIGRTTSTLGLGGLGMLGAGMALKNKNVARAITKVPKLNRIAPEKLEGAAVKTGIVSSGIGGVGGFNQASIYSAEARKRKPRVTKPEGVTKGLGMDMGYFGEQGTPLGPDEIEKAWSPVASKFDSEEHRGKRNRTYQGGALVGAGAATTYAGVHGTKAVQEGRNIQTLPRTAQLHDVKVKTRVNDKKTGTFKHTFRNEIRHGKEFEGLAKEPVMRTLKHGGKALAGAAVAGGAIAGAAALNHKRKSSWQPYAKRDTTSAFGVDHA